MNSISVLEILERARAEGGRLPPAEACALFAAAVRLAAQQGLVPRPHQLRLGDGGALTFSADEEGPLFPEYLAPELSSEDPPRRTEPRVQVYAAGALGYELLTGQVPPVAPGQCGPELTGPLAEVVRLALTADRRERFGDLQQLLDAVEVVQPRPGVEAEEQLLSGLVRRQQRREGPPTLPDASAAALRELVVRVDGLEASLLGLRTQHDAVLKKLAQAAQQVSARQKAEAEHEPLAEWEAEALQRAQRQPAGRVFLVAAGAALLVVLLAGGVLFALRDRLVASLGAPAAATAAPPLAAAPSAPGTESAAAPTQARTTALEPASADAGPIAPGLAQALPAPAPAPGTSPSAAPASAAAAAPEANAPLPEGAALPAAAPAAAGPPAAAPAAPRPRDDRVSSRQIALAVARSQVSRGDKSLEAGNAGEAIASFHTALENQPDLPEAVRGLGMAHAMLGRDREAREEYERYLRLAPQAEDAADIRKAIVELKSRQRISADDK